MRVLVLVGGDSPEREISLLSGQAVFEALLEAGHEAYKLDTLKGFDELANYVDKVDMVFPILHGLNGEDGVAQLELEKRGFTYLGSNSKSSIIAFDKIKAHEVLESHGIKMPAFAKVRLHDVKSHELFKTPYVLKPIEGGSSLDTQIVRRVSQDSIKKSEQLLHKYNEMILEELIVGKEITVPVLGDTALPVIAIIPPENEEFDYQNKYNDKTRELCPAPTDYVTEYLQHAAQEIALNVHTYLGARHLSRTDLIISESGDLYVLELNTMPGMLTQSLFPKAALCAGMSMPQLVNKFVETVKKEIK